MAGATILTDYSTQAARAAEQHRRKVRRELLADVARAIDALSADSVAAIQRISSTEWERAQAQEGDDGA